MSSRARLIFSIAAFFGAWLAAFLLTTVLLPDAIAWVQPLASLAFAIWAARRIWLRLGETMESGRLAYMATGAVVLGGVGFAAGFFGPIIFTPEANQGPLLGIFITGPGGLLLGAALGWLVWAKRQR